VTTSPRTLVSRQRAVKETRHFGGRDFRCAEICEYLQICTVRDLPHISQGHCVHAEFHLFFSAREPKLEEVPLRIARRSLDVHTFRDGPLRNR
jgi:hypothetical protein